MAKNAAEVLRLETSAAFFFLEKEVILQEPFQFPECTMCDNLRPDTIL